MMRRLVVVAVLLAGCSSPYKPDLEGKPVTLSFFTSSTVVEGDLATDAVCAVAIRFTPDAGTEYEAVFAGDAENCRLELGKMRPKTGEGSRTEPVTGAVELPGC